MTADKVLTIIPVAAHEIILPKEIDGNSWLQ